MIKHIKVTNPIVIGYMRCKQKPTPILHNEYVLISLHVISLTIS